MTSSNEQLVPVEQFSIQERDDDMLIAEQHWQLGWRCIARRPKLMTNDEWRPEAERIVVALRTPPAVEPDEGLVRDIRNQIHAIMAGLVDTVGLIDKNPPGPFAVSKDIGESVRALQQVSLKIASLTPSIRAQALEEAAKVAEWSHMVPPDGGSPSEAEYEVAKNAAASIRALKGGQGV